MKKLIYLLCVFSLLSLCACGGGTPSANGTRSVSAKNNAITLDSMTLNFGENKISNGQATLTELTTLENEDVNGLYGSLYILEMEAEYDKPVSVSVAVPNSLPEGEVLLLGIGQDYILDSGETERVYSYIETKIEDGVAVAEFIPLDHTKEQVRLGKSQGSGTTSPYGKLLYCGFFANGHYYEQGHFKLWLPGGFVMSKDTKGKVLTQLEDALNYYKGLGYSFDTDIMNVYVKRGIKEEGFYQPLDGTITLNATLVEKNTLHHELKSTIYHEYFHYIQHCYNKSLFPIKWFDEATASYYEAKSDDTNTTGLADTYINMLYESVMPATDSANAGYARLGLIAYKSMITGSDKWIADIYSGGVTQSELTEAFEKKFSVENYYTYLGMGRVGNYRSAFYFHRDLVDGIVSHNVGGNIHIPTLNEEEAEKVDWSDIFILGSMSFTAKGSAGRVVALSLDSSQLLFLPDTATIVLSGQNCSVTAIKAIGSVSEPIALDGMTIAELRELLYDKARFLFVLTTNGSSDQSNNISVSLGLIDTAAPKVSIDSFTAEVELAEDALPFTQSLSANPSVYGDYYFEWSFGDGQTQGRGANTTSSSGAIHDYTDYGSYPITVTMYDKDGKVLDKDTVTLTVKNIQAEETEVGYNPDADSSAIDKNILINGNAENGMQGWVGDGYFQSATKAGSRTAYEGQYFFWPEGGETASASMYQEVDISVYESGTSMILTGMLANWDQKPHDMATLTLTLYDAGNAALFSESRTHRDPAWAQKTIATTIPVGAVKARVTLQATRFVGSDNDAYFDNLSLTVTEMTVGTVSLQCDSTTAKAGSSVKINVVGGVASDYIWSSSYAALATVDEAGVVTFTSSEEVSIYAVNKTTGEELAITFKAG